jgi:hypothetical protein
MLRAGNYPITIAEMKSYSDDADQVFSDDEHERLKEHLAFFPDAGDPIAGAGGVRQLLWPAHEHGTTGEMQIVYYFRDVNMPLFLLQLCPEGNHIDFDEEWRQEMASLVNELVREYSKHWAEKKPDTSA